MLGLSLAGCAFEAYNGLDTNQDDDDTEDALDVTHQLSSGGTRITYVNSEFLKTRMSGILNITVLGVTGLDNIDDKATDGSTPFPFALPLPFPFPGSGSGGGNGIKNIKVQVTIGGSFAESDPIDVSSINATNNNTSRADLFSANLFITDLAKQRLSLRVINVDATTTNQLVGAGIRGLADLALNPQQPRITVQLNSTPPATVTLGLEFHSFTNDATFLYEASSAAMLTNNLTTTTTTRILASTPAGLVSSPWRALQQAILPPSAADDYLGLDPIALLDNLEADTQCWVFWSVQKKKIVVAFRGTEQDRFKDVLTDLELTPAALDPEGGAGGASTPSVVAAAGAPSAAIAKGIETMVKEIATAASTSTNSASTPGSTLKNIVSQGVQAAVQATAEGQAEIWVHSGFLKAYRAVRAEVLQLVDAILQERSGEEQGWTVFVTGHSLGGALSTLCAYELATRPKWASTANATNTRTPPTIINYSYGSPRVGNKAFADAFNAAVPNAWRVVNNNDAVALVPRLMGYSHVGRMVRLTPEGKVYVNEETAGEGQGVVDVAAAVVTSALAAEKLSLEAATPEEVGLLLKAEMEAMSALMDGSAVAEHLEPLYLANLEMAINTHFITAKALGDGSESSQGGNSKVG